MTVTVPQAPKLARSDDLGAPSCLPGVSPYTDSIFQQPFWLDAVAPGAWDVVELEAGGEVMARWPYIVGRNRLGLTISTMPKLTQTLGPWLAPGEGKYPTQLGRQKEIMSSLVAQLPSFDLFSQNLHYSIYNWLPLCWRGFSQTTKYTYVIESLQDLDSVWDGFEEHTRRNIRRAARQLHVCAGLDVERFLDMSELTFRRQGMSLPYGRDIVHRLDSACSERDARRIFFAEDAKGRVHAAVYIVWDRRSAYYLMGAADPELRGSAAGSLLIWEAIKFASGLSQRFDFEGSMVEQIERFVRGFGGKQKAYFEVSKMSPRIALMRGLADTLGAVKSLVVGGTATPD